ncbi:MAG TPA: hypothetical protein VHC72_10125 [Bryobacteraceae bacterium]|nr:hypothetical protein [Bryobacteraceae bacterium]
MDLSREAIFVYVLNTGVAGRLMFGRVKRYDETCVNVYDSSGQLLSYISGSRIRSWCIVGPGGQAIPSWSSILPIDRERIFSNA